MKREIEVSNRAKKIVRFDARKVKALIRALDLGLPEDLRAPAGDLSIGFFDDAAIAKLHADFLDDPSKTDVITFDGDGDGIFGGEICVSAERALLSAPSFGLTPEEELRLYVAHGYLHLAGIDDIAPADAKLMRAAEAAALKVLRAAKPAPVFNFLHGAD